MDLMTTGKSDSNRKLSTVCSLHSCSSHSAPPSVLAVQELLDQIINHLSESPKDLRACALVSKAWVSRAQHHIFSVITLTRNGWQKNVGRDDIKFDLLCKTRCPFGSRAKLTLIGVPTDPGWPYDHSQHLDDDNEFRVFSTKHHLVSPLAPFTLSSRQLRAPKSNCICLRYSLRELLSQNVPVLCLGYEHGRCLRGPYGFPSIWNLLASLCLTCEQNLDSTIPLLASQTLGFCAFFSHKIFVASLLLCCAC
ncbi:hypothetical protein B0H10DRAFT_1298638 [Mycena sp. CBHHK59/15]|nr:hypothetical protein B0H10DRAFT_1298638 [Mycena sp. CBHHK59/15]